MDGAEAVGLIINREGLAAALKFLDLPTCAHTSIKHLKARDTNSASCPPSTTATPRSVQLLPHSLPQTALS